MRILVDADACPVVRITEQVAKEKGIPVMLLCDTNHVLQSDYSEVITVGAGADAVDFKLVSISKGKNCKNFPGTETMKLQESIQNAIERYILI